MGPLFKLIAAESAFESGWAVKLGQLSLADRETGMPVGHGDGPAVTARLGNSAAGEYELEIRQMLALSCSGGPGCPFHFKLIVLCSHSQQVLHSGASESQDTVPVTRLCSPCAFAGATVRACVRAFVRAPLACSLRSRATAPDMPALMPAVTVGQLISAGSK